MKKSKKTVRKLFLLAAVFAVLASFGCKHRSDGGEKFELKFSVVKDGDGKDNGTLIAIADGKVVSSGAKVKKGAEVRLIGIPIKNRRSVWTGVPKPQEPNIVKFTMQKDENIQINFRLPIMPGDFVNIFTINDVGVGGLSAFDNEFLEHLDDGTNPLYIFDGGKNPVSVNLEVGCTEFLGGDGTIEKVRFIFDNGEPVDVPVEEKPSDPSSPSQFTTYLSKHSVSVADKNEHSLQVEIYPRDADQYSEIVCNFRIRNSELNPVLPGVGFLLNNEQIFNNGHKPDPFDEESAELIMQTYGDIVASVEIIADGKSKTVPIEHYTSMQGEVYYAAGRVLLPTDGTYKQYTIKATPKDTSKYRPAEIMCELAGKKMKADNAEFVTIPSSEGPSAKVDYDITYYDGKKHLYIDCYGQIKVDVTAVTRSARAKVKYLLTDLEGNMLAMPGDSSPQEKEMTSDGACSHSASVTLYLDKPSIFKTYVIAEDGSTTNKEKGERIETFNKIDFKWDKEDKSAGTEFSNIAYDEIKISQADFNSLQTASDGKKYIYAAFKVIKENAAPGVDAYSIKTDGYPAHQGAYKKLDTVENFWVWYKTKIDVTSLTSSAPLEIILPILENNNPCFTYKVKVKITS